MLGEDRAIVVFLLVLWRVDGESLGGMSHLLVADCRGGDLFQRVYPRIAHTIGELLFLSPCHLFGQQVGKGLAYYFLLNGLVGTHLQHGVHAHGHVEELLVEEGHTALDAPGCQTLVGSQTVVEIEFAKLADGFLVEGLGVGCFVEVEIAAKHLVGSLARKHHLDAHASDDACQQIHRCRGAHGGDVVSLDEVDDVADGIESFLYGVVDFVMHGSDVLCHQSGFSQVGSALQSYGEGVQPWPVGLCLASVLYTYGREFLGNGRDDRRVESAAEQHSVGHVAHQLSLHRSLECVVYLFDGSLLLWCSLCQLFGSFLAVVDVVFLLHGSILKPVACVVALHAWSLAVVIMSWEERLVVVALSFECLEFGSHHHLAVVVVADIEWNHADGVTCNQKLVVLCVVEGEGKDAVQLFEHLADACMYGVLALKDQCGEVGVGTHLAIERQNHLAVAACLILIVSGKP